VEFTGAYNHALDPKGRLTLPSSFRDELTRGGASPKFWLSLDRRSVTLAPAAVWREFFEKVRTLPRSDAKAEMVRRTIMATAFDCRTDHQGRALVPPQLRALVEIAREVTLVGAGDHVEIWDRAKWTDYFRQGHESLDVNTSSLPL
jgi:MraZ protein